MNCYPVFKPIFIDKKLRSEIFATAVHGLNG